MSHIATKWAFQVRGLRPSAKVVLWALADAHNPVKGCFPSQEYLAEICEMSIRSVRDQIKHLIERGLIKVEKRKSQSGTHLASLYHLAIDGEIEGETAAETTGKMRHDPPAKDDSSHRQILPPNPVKEPVKEPASPPVARDTEDHFEEFWKAYSRVRDRDRCQELFSQAVSAGADPRAIVRAAWRYRAEKQRVPRQYHKCSDNWLAERCWEGVSAAPDEGAQVTTADLVEFWANAINSKRFIPSNAIRSDILAEIAERGLASREAIREAGLAA